MTKSKLLDGLPLSVPTGGLVTPLIFSSDTIKTLGQWLNPNQIERLRNCAEISKNIISNDRENPTLGDQRKVLEKAGELAEALATILQQAPMHAEAELNLIFHKYVGGLEQHEQMAVNLKMLAFGINASLQDLPKQDRRKSPVHFVSMIADVLHDADIKPSASENSRFYKICQAAFDAIGVYQSPAAPIRVFIS